MSIDCPAPVSEIFPLELNSATGDKVGGVSVPVGGQNRSTQSLGTPRQVYGNEFRSFYSTPTIPRVSNRTRSISISSEHHRILNGVKGNSAAILYRKADGTPVLKSLASLSLDEHSTMEENEHIASFFKWYKCYDLMPTSAKLVVLDTRLIVKKAFYAMVDTGVRACILWDSGLKQYVGMLTITDFIRILQNNYKGQGEAMAAFEEQRLCDVKGVTTEAPSDVYHMYPESSLYSAAMILLQKKIHRLPIIDPVNGNVLSILTQKPLVKFLYTFFPNLETLPVLAKSIREAGVGTFDNIKVATMDMTIIEALNLFVEESISALPIVDEAGKLVHIYSKFDVINLAAEKTYSYLDVSLKEATKHKTWFSGVHNCKADESVYLVMERLVKTDVARLVVTDQDDQVIGVVTVSDIIFYLIFHGDDCLDSSNCALPTNISRSSLIGSMSRSSLSRNSLGGSISSNKSLSSSYSPPSVFNV